MCHSTSICSIYLLPRTQTSLSRWKFARKGRREGENGLPLPSVPFPWSLAVHHQSLDSTLRKTKRLRRRLLYLYNIISRRFVHVHGLKTVGAWIWKNSLFSLWYLSWTVPRYFQKLHDALTDMNEKMSTSSLAVLLFYTASFFFKMMVWSLYPPHWKRN